MGLFSLFGVAVYFKEFRVKTAGKNLDILGAILLSGSILGLLTLIISGGRELPFTSLAYILTVIGTTVMTICFYRVEARAENPMLNFRFFVVPSYTLGNVLVFFASFAIFSLFAYAPIFLQGALSETPMQVGYAMVSLSIGWSIGSFLAGRNMARLGQKNWTIIGAVLVVLGTGMTLHFSLTTSMVECFTAFLIVGFGMGFVSLTTLLVVQDSVEQKDLGTATSFHQFSRTMGGTIGVGLCGGVVTERLVSELTLAGQKLPDNVIIKLKESTANLFQEEFQALIPPGMESILQNAVLNGVYYAFVIIFVVSLINFGISCFLPRK